MNNTFILIMRKWCQANTSSYSNFCQTKKGYFSIWNIFKATTCTINFSESYRLQAMLRWACSDLTQYSCRSTALLLGQHKGPWGLLSWLKPWQLSTPMKNYQNMTSAEWYLSLLLTSRDSGSSKAHFLLSPMSCDTLTILLQLLELTGVNLEQVTPILASPLIASVFLVFFLC